MPDKRIVIIPDCHIPDHHRKALANVFRFIGDYQPDEVLFLGDLIDFKPVARWSKDTIDECGQRMQAEADAADAVLTEFRSIYGGPAKITTGNHEARWTTYMAKYAPGIFGMRDFTLGKVFHLDRHDIEIVKQPHPISQGVRAIHGDKLGITAGASALKELRRHGTSIVQGHSHRLGIVYHTTDRRRFAAEFGWLGDQSKASYISFGLADWQLGFGLLTQTGSTVTPELIPVESNGSFLVHGRRYA